MNRLIAILAGVFVSVWIAFALLQCRELGVAHADAARTYVDDDGDEVLVIETDPGSASALVPAPAKPSSAIDNPLDNPIAAFDDLAAARRHGWPAFVLALGIMLALTARRAGHTWPEVGWLAWLNTGARAFVITGVFAVASAAFDALILGGTWIAIGWAAFGALLALVSPFASQRKAGA